MAKPLQFDEEYVMIQLNDMKKQGYCSIETMTAWIRNQYRDITIEKAVNVINKWIDEYKIKHEHLVVVRTKKSVYVLKETEYNQIMTKLKLARRSKQ